MQELMAAGGLKANEAGRPNWIYEFNPDVADKWFGLRRIEREVQQLEGGEIRPIRLGRFGVHGDGSCAYHSICTALNWKDYVHQTDEQQKQIAYQFRCSFGDKLNKEKLSGVLKKVRGGGSKELSVVKLQENLCDPKVWADETALRLVGDALDVNLIFLDMDKNAMYCGMHHEDALDKDARKLPPTIVVLWVSHSHFEPMAHILGLGERVANVKVLLEPSKSEADARLVAALMARYKTQCKLKR